MHIIDNLPVILAAGTAIAAGIYGYAGRWPSTVTYKYMCLFIVCFYFIGFLAKRTIIGIKEENEAKKMEQMENLPSEDDLLYHASALDASVADGEPESGMEGAALEGGAEDGMGGAGVMEAGAGGGMETGAGADSPAAAGEEPGDGAEGGSPAEGGGAPGAPEAAAGGAGEPAAAGGNGGLL